MLESCAYDRLHGFFITARRALMLICQRRAVSTELEFARTLIQVPPETNFSIMLELPPARPTGVEAAS